MNFQGIKDRMVDWLRQDLHWMKKDYIQAKQISTFDVIAYTYSVVNYTRTRQALEKVVSAEIQRDVKIDLKIIRVVCKNEKAIK